MLEILYSCGSEHFNLAHVHVLSVTMYFGIFGHFWLASGILGIAFTTCRRRHTHAASQFVDATSPASCLFPPWSSLVVSNDTQAPPDVLILHSRL